MACHLLFGTTGYLGNYDTALGESGFDGDLTIQPINPSTLIDGRTGQLSGLTPLIFDEHGFFY